MLRYLQWVVRELRLFEEIQLIFPVTGHTKNRLDERHAHPAQLFFHHEANNISDLEHLLTPNAKYCADWMVCFYDWDNFFSSLAKFPLISVPHMFSITKDGIRSKIDAHEEWSTHSGGPQLNEPVDLFLGAPLLIGDPTRILPAPLTEQRRADLAECIAKMHLDGEKASFLTELVRGGTGATEDMIAACQFKRPSPPQHTSPPHTQTQLLPQPQPQPQPPAQPQAQAPPQNNVYATKEILSHRTDKKGTLEYQVRWADDSVAWVKRKQIDYIRNNVHYSNPQLDAYDKEHPEIRPARTPKFTVPPAAPSDTTTKKRKK